MNDTFTNFLEAYTKAPQNVKDLIDSEEIGLFIDTLLSDTPVVVPKQKLMVIISNRVLDLMPDSQMIEQLENIGLVEPEKIAQIKNFVNTKVSVGSAENISSEIAETEAALGAINIPPIHSIRTMAGDGKVVGYQSTQENTYSSDQSNLLQK